jgi:hypothetical protein
MAEKFDAFVTACFPQGEIPLLEFAAKECGQTKSSFLYVAARDRMRAMGLLPMPTIPKPNGQGAHAQTAPTPMNTGSI